MSSQKRIEELVSHTLDDLLEKAWRIRRENFDDMLSVFAPSAKTYDIGIFRNTKNRFVNISITGDYCELNCDHCQGKLLESMIPATSPQHLVEIADNLMSKGCKGMLISGGSLVNGKVPLDNYFEAIKYLKQKELRVIVHTGLVNERTAQNLKEVGVDQVLMDIIVDEKTIREVYHLDKKPEDFKNSLTILKDIGLSIAPHVVIGLYYGKVRGELNAINFITEIDPDVIILVILSPIYDTPMQDVVTPSPKEIARIAAIARIKNPCTQIALGCASPAGPKKISTEKLMIHAGINAIAYPMEETVRYAQDLGLRTDFKETCCSLLQNNATE